MPSAKVYSVLLVAVMMSVVSTGAYAATGTNCYFVPEGGSAYDFTSTPIPADFFGPGSDPFDGNVCLAGSDPMTLVSLHDLPYGPYDWRIVAKDDMGGQKYGPLWTDCNPFDMADLDCDNDIDLSDFSHFVECFGATEEQPGYCYDADFEEPFGSIGLEDLSYFSQVFLDTCCDD